MVELTVFELGVLMIEVERTVWGDMHCHLAGDQARLIFLAKDLQHQTTIRDSVIGFHLTLGGGGEEAVQIQLGG